MDVPQRPRYHPSRESETGRISAQTTTTQHKVRDKSKQWLHRKPCLPEVGLLPHPFLSPPNRTTPENRDVMVPLKVSNSITEYHYFQYNILNNRTRFCTEQ